MADISLSPHGAQAKANRLPALDADFEPIITSEQFAEFRRTRFPGVVAAMPLAFSLARHGRADLIETARGLASTTVNDEGGDGLMRMLDAISDLIDFCESSAEILHSVRARLLIAADDLIIAEGGESVMGDEPFDAHAWIERATAAGATMFVRDDELWIGAAATAGASREIDRLKDELDEDARDAVRNAIAARGLVCVEA